MRKLISLLSIFLILFSYSKCNLNDSDSNTKKYQYTGYDSTGVTIVQGLLSIEFKDSGKIEGNWNLAKIASNSVNIGPQNGAGYLKGGVRNDTAWIELNPQYIDNNVSLIGILNEQEYNGKWIYTSYIGLTNWGTFEAVKR